MYRVARSLLFKLPPETAHHLALKLLESRARLGFSANVPRLPVRVMGLNFANPVGLAAGLDKNAEAIEGLASLGFGFIEVGTVTPRAQPGNPKPRLFRLPEAGALINRMGFNNQGLDALLSRVRVARFNGVLGINIGKNADTPLERAVDDYLFALDRVYLHADYVALNLSSPNTPELRRLQFGDNLKQLLEALNQHREILAQRYKRHVPIAVKIAPDMSEEDSIEIAQTLFDSGMDAVIATNTTVSREGVTHLPQSSETGGLSGTPLRMRSTQMVEQLASVLKGRLPIIAVGGISEGEHAAEKIKAGASLIQLYSGLIYQGPKLIEESIKAIAALNML